MPKVRNRASAWVRAPEVRMAAALSAPHAAPIARPARRAGTCPSGPIREMVTTATRLMMPATERSMKPPMMTKVMPRLTMIRGPNWRMMLIRFRGVRNLGSTIAVRTTSTVIITRTR